MSKTGGMVVYTDGGCSPNPGAGAWAFAIFERGPAGSDMKLLRQGSGSNIDTTNNRMEMMACLEAMNALLVFPSETHVEFITDSKYLLDGINSWSNKWEANGWTASGGKPVLNVDMWKRLREAKKLIPNQSWTWVKGHMGVAGNELCDALCTRAMNALRAENSKYRRR